jgi:hypothetical protein
LIRNATRPWPAISKHLQQFWAISPLQLQFSVDFAAADDCGDETQPQD